MEIILYILSMFFGGLGGEHFNDEHRMLNGTPAKLGQFPFAAAIVGVKNDDPYAFGCSAMLISSKHCLTAAHCFQYIQPTDNMGGCMVGDVNVFGDKPKAESRQLRKTIKFILYPGYNTTRVATHDVALITVESPFEMNAYVATIPLASTLVKEGDSTVALGFGGQTRSNDTFTKPTETDLAWDYFTVQGAWCETIPEVVCVAHPYRGVWFGDSGGPLITRVRNPELLGVLSAFVHGEDPPNAAKYLSIPQKRDWILKEINSDKRKRSVGLKVTSGQFFAYFELIVLIKNF